MFVGVDGEGVTLEETGEHIYTMMASSLENSAVNLRGISTQDAFRFLFETKRAAGKGSILCGYAITYDVNMMLRDVSKPNLVELQKTNRTEWRHYRIEFVQGKWFTLHDRRLGRALTVYDVIGFFQCSFVKALEGWKVPAPPMIDHMKRRRSEFNKDMTARILEYCIAECRALVKLMDALKASLKSVGLEVRRWHGAGAIANSLLGREGVHEHIQDDEVYGELQEGIMSAYFGGRSELFQQGEFPVLYGYDIRSAYPAACLTLPSLIDARFVRDDSTTPSADAISLHYVEWDVDPDAYIMPFPYRYKRSNYYPSQGAGWYWSCEVAAARAIHGDGIAVVKSYRLVGPHLDRRPLAFVHPIYRERARLKRDGHFGHQSLKLAINSLYGKLAQGTAYQGRDGRVTQPRYRTYVWAGWITAYTRARMMQLATPDVVAIATDGIFFTRDPGYECGGGLGELEASYMRDAFIAQPGIYTGTGEDGVVHKSRGVYVKEVDYDDLRRGYWEEGPYFTSVRKTTRFVGLGTAVGHRRFSGYWRRWIESERQITLYPSRKFIHDDSARPLRHVPPRKLADGPSEPYIPKVSGIDAPGMTDYIQALEQPMKA